jgi:hypothetical protein
MSESLPLFDHAQSLSPFGLRMPTRMTVLPFGDGALALVSPVPLDQQKLAELAALGDVRYLIAPNLLHSLYLQAAAERFPAARVLAPSRLREKQPGLRIDATLESGLPDDLAQAVELVAVAGAPALDEFLFFHRASRTLVATDLVFNMVAPEGWFTNLVLTLVGCRGKLAQSRAWRFAVRDRSAARASVERALALPFETLVVAHGEVVREQARVRLGEALSWLLSSRLVLPAMT